MKQTRMVASGVYSYPKRRIAVRLIKCGFILYVFLSSLDFTVDCSIKMLAAIGETFDPHLTSGETSEPNSQSLITGVIVSTRPQFYRLSIWTRLAPSGDEDKLRERIETVGRHFKINVLGYPETQKLAGPLATEVEFLSHKDSEKKGKAAKKLVI
jgi:translation initiation factor 4E